MFSKIFITHRILVLGILGILLLAATLRFWQLGRIPEGFHADEAAFGYNAYSILKTGKDEYAKPYPLILQSFNDYKGAIYAYLTIPFILIQGLNEWSVRAPSAVFGVLFVLLTFALVYKISTKLHLALLSMMLAGISPVGIMLSRVQSDPLVCVFFFYLGYYLWLLWFEKKNICYYFLSIISIIVSFYTYPSTRLFVLPFLILMGVLDWPGYSKKIRLSAVFAFLCVGIVVGAMSLTSARVRLTQISVFSKMDVQLPLDEKIREDGAMGMSVFATRVFHNKVTAYGQFLFDNFADYISYKFLFRQAGQPVREAIPDSGVLLLIELPFFLIGIYSSFKNRFSYGIKAVLWFLLVPAILSIARDETPNIHRFFLATIPLHMVVAIGIATLYKKFAAKYKIAFYVTVSSLFFVNVVFFLHQLFIHQPIHQPTYRNNTHNELANALKKLYVSYDVVVSQKILEQMLFYWPVDPGTYQAEGSPRDLDNAWYRNFLFVTDACPSSRRNPVVQAIKNKRILYVDLPECPMNKHKKIIKSIVYRNTLEAFRLVVRDDWGFE